MYDVKSYKADVDNTQVIGIAVDPYSTGVDASFVYSTIEITGSSAHAYMYRHYVGTEEAEFLYSTNGKFA